MPEWLILTLKIIMGPIVGAIIGLFTNWLAVKMLFHPYNELRLGKLRIPFTPGIIPKRRKAMATALGKAVGTALITPTDIQRLFVTDEIKEKVGNMVADAVCTTSDTVTLNGALNELGEEKRGNIIGKASALVTEKLVTCMQNTLPSLLSEHSADILHSLGGIGGMLGLIGGKKFLGKLTTAVGDKLEAFLDEKGYDALLPVVQSEIDKILNTPVREYTEKAALTRETVSAFAGSVYEKFVVSKIVSFVAEFDIAGIVEKKINDMDMAELERLFMSVMKRELRAIVNLGGVLGAFVGIVNSLIAVLI